MPAQPSFNLIDEPWVEVLYHGSVRPEHVSLRQLFDDMASIGRLVGDPPVIEAVLQRLLLAITIDAHGGCPSDLAGWRELADRGLDRGRIDDYLDQHHSRFDLFDPEVPFAQVAGLHTNSGVKPVTLLMATMPSGNNVPLHVPVTDRDDLQLSPAEAARWLLTCHAIDGGGIKSGATADPNAKHGKVTAPKGVMGFFGVTIPEGGNVEQTLLLNTPCTPASDTERAADRPWWRRSNHPDAAWSEREPDGLLDRLTWLSRRIRLERDGDGTVTGCVITAGDAPPMAQAHKDNRGRSVPPQAHEPHVTTQYVQKTKADPGRWAPKVWTAGVAGWRHLDSLLATVAGGMPTAGSVQPPLVLQQLASKAHHLDLIATAALYGVEYDSNGASVTDLAADRFTLPVDALEYGSETRDFVLLMVTSVDSIRNALNGLHGDLRRCLGEDRTVADVPADRFVHDIDPVLRQLLHDAAHDADLDRLEEVWCAAARSAALRVADEVFDEFPPRVFIGHDTKPPSGKPVRHRAAQADLRFLAAVRDAVGGAPARTSDSQTGDAA